FKAVDGHGNSIYHTNVMMSIGDGFAVVCPDSIADSSERNTVVRSLQSDGREVLSIDLHQLNRFTGNILHLRGGNSRSVIAMSTEAFLAFTPEQRKRLQKYGEIIESPIPIIEAIEGGSARCMLAGIHLPLMI